MRLLRALACVSMLVACSRKTTNTVAPDPAPSVSSAPPIDRLPADTTITLERGRCFGPCPSYRVSLFADGRVAFESLGGSYPHEGDAALVPDAGAATIDASAVLALMNRIRAAGFFDMADDYPTHWTDKRTMIVTVTIDGKTKSIRDEGGPDEELHDHPPEVPRALRDVEADIDRVANVGRWIGAPPAD